MIVTIHNEKLTVDVSTRGAELQSIRSNEREYLWQGDPAYWNRRSPILFPNVGSVWEGRYRFGGKEFNINQHGFARDMEFTVVEQNDTHVLMALESTPETLVKYPSPFRLTIGYTLTDRTVTVHWGVENTGQEEMHFQIGGHPAFYWDNSHETERGTLLFDAEGPLHGTLLHSKGCIHPEPQYFEAPLQNGVYSMQKDTFYPIDTLVLEHDQVHSVELRDNNAQPIVRLRFQAPVIGIWTPTDLDAPFVCLEPWYGRCDRAFNEGEFSHNDWTNHLQPAAKFEADYTIELF